MTAGSKIKDDKQEYQYSLPWRTPSGHEFSFYDTPDNQRLVVRHASGSHLEFKADGSVFIKAITDIHTHGSVLSTPGSEMGSTSSSDSGTMRMDADQTWEIGGKLTIKCQSLDFEVGSYAKMIAGTDFQITGNNIMTKATESISLESSKSLYFDTKEMRERIVSRRSEAGTKEKGKPGGINILNVHGNAIIQNNDPDGGITISSKGYLNLVAGQERVDITGRWTGTPSAEAVGTWTQKVFMPEKPGKLSVSTPGGDYYFESDSTAYYRYATTLVDKKYIPYGLQQQVQRGDANYHVMIGNYEEMIALDSTVTIGKDLTEIVAKNRERTVGKDEDVNIAGIQTIKAAKIFLN